LRAGSLEAPTRHPWAWRSEAFYDQFDGVDRCKCANLPLLRCAVDAGYDILAPIPSRVLMFKQQLPLMYPQESDAAAVNAQTFDPFEYLSHQTREVLRLVPGTEIEMIERCSGHDGTHGVKRTSYPHARKIAQAVAELLKRAQPAHLSSDCPMAVAHLAAGLESGAVATHRISLLGQAYGI
jgi:hypothetical protein